MFIKALERVEEQNSKGYKLTDCDKNSWWEDFKAYISCTIKQNHTWSEEDEENRIDAIKYLELFDAQGIHGNVVEPCINWLKSLKDKM